MFDLYIVLRAPRRHLTLNSRDPAMAELSFTPGLYTTANSVHESFVGISVEWSRAQSYTKQPAFAALMSHLSPRPNIRIGGNSADTSWWDPDNEGLNSTCSKSYNESVCCKYTITAEDIIAHQKCAEIINGTLTLDLNLLDSSGEYAITELEKIVDTVGLSHVDAFEIGNEPDLFYENGIRGPDYSLEDFTKEFDFVLNKLSKQDVKFQGGTFCCKSKFVQGQSDIMATQKDLLSTWSYHRYPTSTCNGKNVSLAQLMSDESAVGQANLVKNDVASAAANGLPFVIGESNSASCSGQTNVSDTIASALWFLDYGMNLAAVNVSRVNLHGGGAAPYSWLGEFVEDSAAPDVRPLYYGMKMLADFTKNNARILKLDGAAVEMCHSGISTQGGVCCASSCGICGGDGCNDFPGGSSLCCAGVIEEAGRFCDATNSSDVGCLINPDSEELLKSWAVYDHLTNEFRVLIVNKNQEDLGPKLVKIHVKNKEIKAQAMLHRLTGLTADGFGARYNISIASQTFDGSKEGELVGDLRLESVMPFLADGTSTFSVNIQSAQAAMLVIADK